MAIKNCVECGCPVSTDAKACPRCGKPNPVPQQQMTAGGCFLALLLMGGFVYFVNHHGGTQSKSDPVEEQQQRVAATQKAQDDFNKAAAYVKNLQAKGFIYSMDVERSQVRVNPNAWRLLDVDLKKNFVFNVAYYQAAKAGRQSPTLTVMSNLNDNVLAEQGWGGDITVKE